LKKNKIKSSCIFIDWNNVRKLFPVSAGHNQSARIQRTILNLQVQFATILKNIDSTSPYKVQTRFYDGWHRKDTPTSALLEMEKALSNWSLERTIGRIYFHSEPNYGNSLACDSYRNPLTSTSRDAGQKMVDTSIACDFLYMLQSRQIDIGLIASDDDDFIPAALTAEAWGLSGYLIRTQGRGLEEVTKKSMNSPIKFWS
jgi:uncharacterized LabA/DUF88 family protein